MKNIFLFLVVFVSGISISAQEDTTHFVTHYGDGKLNESYIINSQKQKNGEYVRYNHFGKKYISGQYKNGEPIGIWEFYSSDSTAVLVQKLDFDAHKELFVDPLRIPQMICGPRYFGGNMLKNEFIEHHIATDFTSEEKKMYAGQSFSVLFTIDSVSLKPVGISISDEQKLSPDFSAKLIAAVAAMPAWLPPACENKNKVWRFSVKFVF